MWVVQKLNIKYQYFLKNPKFFSLEKNFLKKKRFISIHLIRILRKISKLTTKHKSLILKIQITVFREYRDQKKWKIWFKNHSNRDVLLFIYLFFKKIKNRSFLWHLKIFFLLFQFIEKVWEIFCLTYQMANILKNFLRKKINKKNLYNIFANSLIIFLIYQILKMIYNQNILYMINNIFCKFCFIEMKINTL